MKTRLEFDLNEAEDRMSLKRSIMSEELALTQLRNKLVQQIGGKAYPVVSIKFKK